MKEIMEYLPILLPIFLIEVTLMIIALVHIFRHKEYRFGNRLLWVIVVLVGNLIGSVVYLTIGKEKE